jgi:hypothetical protein
MDSRGGQLLGCSGDAACALTAGEGQFSVGNCG